MYIKPLLLCLALVATTGDIEAARRCKTADACYNNPQCQCYCSEKGGFRAKTSDDSPVYVEDDPNGIYCYCKQWDLDKYPGPATRPSNQKSYKQKRSKTTYRESRRPQRKMAEIPPQQDF